MPPMMEIITAEQLMEYLGKAATRFTQWHIRLTLLMKWRGKTQFCVWLVLHKLT